MSNNNRKLIPCIYLYEGKAVKGINDKTVICNDPLEVVNKYIDLNVDDLMVYDLSEGLGDEAHERAIDIIKDICKASDASVIGCGNIKRMEDVKKLLYAGCQKAALNLDKAANIEIMKEVSDKFGKDKIFAMYSNNKQLADNKELLEKLTTSLIKIISSEAEICEESIDLAISYVIDDYENSYETYKKAIKDKNLKLYSLEPAFSWADLKKNSDGMVPVIVQDYKTDQVLMLAYMNEEAYNKTLETGKMTYFSRSRQSLWLKGETSSHFQFVKSLYADCDLDTILAKVKQIGAACHTGKYSCFFNEIAKKDYVEKNPQKVLDSVFDVIQDRKVNPREGSYTNYLFDKGIDKILKKVGEEATEIVIAAKNPNDNEIVYEMSDFLYHMMVLMAEKNVSWEDITDELARR